MSPVEPKEDTDPPAPAPGGAVPRNGSGADTAFLAMVKKRKGRDGDAETPPPIHADGDKSRQK